MNDIKENESDTMTTEQPATLDDLAREVRALRQAVEVLAGERGNGAAADFIDAKALAKRLDISVPTLYRQVAAGELPKPKKFGTSSRWKMNEVDALIHKRK